MLGFGQTHYLIVPFGFGPALPVIVALALLVLIWRLHPRLMVLMSDAGLSTEKLYLTSLMGVAIVLSPLWVMFIFYTLQALFVLIGESPAAVAIANRLPHFAALSALLLTLGAMVSLPLLLIKTFLNERTIANEEAKKDITAHGLVTDRFTKAVTQLGAVKNSHHRVQAHRELPDGRIVQTHDTWTETVPNLEIRLGALFALERISQTNAREHIAVMETICAYIRENGTAKPDPEADPEQPPQFLPPRADIQMAIKILGRRSTRRMREELATTPPFQLDLRGAELPSVDFSGGTFGPVMFERANLSGAWFDGASLISADFTAAVMTEAWFEETDLRRTRMEEADLRGAWFANADLTSAEMAGADLRTARLRGACLKGAELDSAYMDRTDVSGADLTLAWLRAVDCGGMLNLTQDQIDTAQGDTTTDLPKHLVRPMWPRQDTTYMESFEFWQDAKKEAGLA